MGFSDLEAIGIIQNTTYTERYFRKNKKKIMEELSTCKNDMGFEQCHHICDEGKSGLQNRPGQTYNTQVRPSLMRTRYNV